MDDQLKLVHGGVAQTNTTDSPGAPTTSSPFPKEDTDSTTSTSSCDCGSGVVTNAAAVDTVLSENGKDSEAKVSSFDVTSNNTTSCMLSNTVASTLTTTTTTGSPSTFTASDTAGSDSSLDHRLSECNINKNEDGSDDNVPDKNPLLEVGLMQPIVESNKAIMENTTSNEMETSKSDNANNHVSVNHPGSPDSGDVELTSAMQQQGKHEHSREQQPVIKPLLSSDGRSTSQVAEQNTTQSWNKTSEAGMEESNNVERQLSRTTCPQAVPLETIPKPGDHEQSRITLNKKQTNVQVTTSTASAELDTPETFFYITCQWVHALQKGLLYISTEPLSMSDIPIHQILTLTNYTYLSSLRSVASYQIALSQYALIVLSASHNKFLIRLFYESTFQF